MCRHKFLWTLPARCSIVGKNVGHSRPMNLYHTVVYVICVKGNGSTW